jgi:hypothetical protein
MKAFDAFLDRQSRDLGMDRLSSRLLSREVDSTLRMQPGEKQRLTGASNYFALACPIMPIGLLGALILLDGLDSLQDEQQPHMTKADEIAQRNQENTTQAVYLMAMKQKQERENKKTPLACSRPLDFATKPNDKTQKGKNVEVRPAGKRSERISGPNLLSKTHNDVDKLVKQKMALESHLEKLSQEQDYAMHCRVSAQLDLLDKALKKLGA